VTHPRRTSVRYKHSSELSSKVFQDMPSVDRHQIKKFQETTEVTDIFYGLEEDKIT
jgi:hypothetical protein